MDFKLRKITQSILIFNSIPYRSVVEDINQALGNPIGSKKTKQLRRELEKQPYPKPYKGIIHVPLRKASIQELYKRSVEYFLDNLKVANPQSDTPYLWFKRSKIKVK